MQILIIKAEISLMDLEDLQFLVWLYLRHSVHNIYNFSWMNFDSKNDK